MNHSLTLSRRRFIKTSLATAGGLTLGVYLGSAAAEQAGGEAGDTALKTSNLQPNAFIRINEDNTVTVLVKHLEMGQGTYTGLTTLVAEEMDADWAQMRAEGAPADMTYKNLAFGMQGTGGSTSMANSFLQMREAGAAARAMLVAAAAAAWEVPAAEITVKAGVISHPGGKQASFGEFAQAAAEQSVPEQVMLKSPEQFVYIGKPNLQRLDVSDKTSGKARYTQDVQLPDMLTALVAHAPKFGATVKSVDDSQALQIKGVVEVVQIPTGVAVLAEDFWSAKQGRDALKIEWDDGEAYTGSSDEEMARYRELAKQAGTEVRKEGQAEEAFAGAAKVLTAGYEFPYLAHAAMEPMNCVVHLREDGCEIWNGDQMQTLDQGGVAAIVGLEPGQVKINTLYAGGSFGRRGNPNSDYVREAAHIAKAASRKVPIKMVWTREDDTRAGFYRPMFYHQLRAALDGDGQLTAWEQTAVGQSILAGTPMAPMMQGGPDPMSTEGSAEPYAIPNVSLSLHTPDNVGVPVQWWRSVGHTHTGFVTECFMDELAHAAGRDPVEFRRALLQEHPRHLQVLELAAEKAGWGSELPPNRGRGIALVKSFNTYVAEVAEVTVQEDGSFSVDKVVVAVDCGVVVNPDVVYAQMGGGVGFALSAALGEKITLKNGEVEQSNFHNYPVMRMPQMPVVEVHIVASTENPSGVGEPAVPPLAPAVANALFAATGKRMYQLPLGNKA
ncbi:MAG: xanthine dehydrogenase family protein molybdopterin-binding subunit [Thiolinea sp.]